MKKRGFTLLELLVSTTVLITLLTLLGHALTQSESLWDRGRSRMRLLASGRAALGVIRADLESAFATNLYVLVAEEEASVFGDVPLVTDLQSGFDIDETFGSPNAGLFFYRFSATPREGCYPVEAVCYSVTNSASSDAPGVLLPRLVRHTCRFSLSQDDPGDLPGTEAWEEGADFPDVEDVEPLEESLPKETGLPRPAETRVASMELLDGVVALYCRPVSMAGNEDGDATADAVDVYLELLAPAQCRRVSRLAEDRQKDYVAKNAVRLSARFSLLAHPAFHVPGDLVPRWENR
ncbi:MAG: prepilin-type N-terminal cleavage/methylation domain-containing protein [Kiritimatiellia bacterium]|jgi:type II secretory pathway pseudopilin PulG